MLLVIHGISKVIFYILLWYKKKMFSSKMRRGVLFSLPLLLPLTCSLAEFNRYRLSPYFSPFPQYCEKIFARLLDWIRGSESTSFSRYLSENLRFWISRTLNSYCHFGAIDNNGDIFFIHTLKKQVRYKRKKRGDRDCYVDKTPHSSSTNSRSFKLKPSRRWNCLFSCQYVKFFDVKKMCLTF